MLRQAETGKVRGRFYHNIACDRVGNTDCGDGLGETGRLSRRQPLRIRAKTNCPLQLNKPWRNGEEGSTLGEQEGMLRLDNTLWWENNRTFGHSFSSSTPQNNHLPGRSDPVEISRVMLIDRKLNGILLNRV